MPVIPKRVNLEFLLSYTSSLAIAIAFNSSFTITLGISIFKSSLEIYAKTPSFIDDVKYSFLKFNPLTTKIQFLSIFLES